MNNDIADHLKSLHTSAIDARNGYLEAVKAADDNGMIPLFREMAALHDGHADELARQLNKANELPDEQGSFMTLVHETVMDVRSLFNGLDESVLPGLIDGEKRNLAKYDDALSNATPPVSDLLTRQRGSVATKITAMEAQKAAHERAA